MDFDPTMPFRRSTGIAAGVSPKELRGPGYRLVLPGTYVRAATVVTPLLRVRAALLPYGTVARASHASAARVYDLPIPTIAEEHVSVPRAGLRRRLTTPEALVAFCSTVSHRAAAAARRAAAYVRSDVDSPMESRLRLLIVLAGLPEPRVNLTVRDDAGEVVRKYDLSYPLAKVAVEYNGKVHVLTLEAWEEDLERRDAIDDEGWRLVPVISSGIYAKPEQTLRRVHRVLLARGQPGVPLRLSDAWRPHFPGHADAT